MNAARWCALGAIALWVSGAGVTACVGGDSSSQDGGNGDASTDGTVDSSTPDFSLSVSPTSVLVDPGGATVAVTVNVTRSNGFAEPINLTLTGGPADVTGSGTVVGTATTAVFNISAGGAASVGQTANATITAISGNTNVTHTAALFVRVGHVLLITDQSTMWTVPTDVGHITVLAWGAGGGGASGGNYNTAAAATGGPGGFIQSSFPVNAGDSISVIVGTAGTGGPVTGQTNNWTVTAGAGGGYSALAEATDAGADAANYYLVVGAGGGGYTNGATVSSGGAGGGGDGGNAGGPNYGTGRGASITAGGYLNGAFLQGGQQVGPVTAAGGNPGGGNTIQNSDPGGGGGYYGGGSGSGCGGGGGSGYVRSDGTNTVLDIGTGTAAPQTSNPYYAAPVAIGGDGGAAAGSQIQPAPPTAGQPGGHGRVVILVAQ